MFERVRQRVRDVKTIGALCKGAERHARDDGQREPGAEHFLLSALDLPDGSARRVLERLQVDASQVRGAIRRQYADALRHAGVDPAALDALVEPPQATPRQPAPYRASASGQAVMQGLAQLREHDKDAALLGAHVIAVIASMQQGVAARTLRALGVDTAALAAAAAEEVRASASS